MKYTIEGFDQALLVEFKLDNTDALILRWFVDFFPKMATVEFEGVKYNWVKYSAIIDDLPCIGITNNQVIARRFEKFINCGIMAKHVEKRNGNFTCFKLTQKYLSLVEGSTKKLIGVDSKVDRGINSKVDTKDSSINKDSSIKTQERNQVALSEFEQISNFTESEIEFIEKWISFRAQQYKCKKTHQAVAVLLNHLVIAKTNGYDIVKMIDYFMTYTTYQNINAANIALALKNKIAGEQNAS